MNSFVFFIFRKNINHYPLFEMLSEFFEKKLHSNQFQYTDEATEIGHVCNKCLYGLLLDEQKLFYYVFRER